MNPVITYRDGDLYSAIVGNEVTYQLPRPVIVGFILAKVEGATEEIANEWLDSPVSPEVFRASHLAALSTGVEDAREEISAILDKDRARELSAKFELLQSMLESIDQRLAVENQLKEQANSIEADKVDAIKAETERQERLERERKEAAERERKVQAESAERQRRAHAEAEAERIRAYWTDKARRFELRGNEVWAWELMKPGQWKRGHTFKLIEVPSYIREKLKPGIRYSENL